MTRFYAMVCFVMSVSAMMLIGAAVKQFISPQIIYNDNASHINITYSHMWPRGCVDVTWTVSGSEGMFIQAAGTVSEGHQTYCETFNGPAIEVDLPNGIHLNYDREMLWQSIETHLWLAALCVCMVAFLSQHFTLLIVALPTLIGIAVWVAMGSPALPVSMALALMNPMANLGRVLVLAILVPPFYWLIVPPRFRVLFLLGIGLLMFAAQDIAFEYLLLLGVLIVWVSELWPSSEPTPQISILTTVLCSVLLVAFSAVVVLSTSLSFSQQASAIIVKPLLYSISLSTLSVWVWQVALSRTWQSFLKGLVMACVLLSLLYMDIFSDAEARRLIPGSILLLGFTALLLASLAFRVGPRLSSWQRQFLAHIGIIVIISLFIIFKLPQAAMIGWISFSYIAFRLLHVLLEHHRNTLLTPLSTSQFALYTTFFSTQQVGPIGLLPQMETQLQKNPDFSWEAYGEGWQRILWGAIKKFFIADVLLSIVLPKTIPLEFMTVQSAWFQIYVYAFYLYCDFSGFLDIALGLARLVGYWLPENFDSPYTKGSLAQFWQSWHMTLSSWVRIYVYLPLSRSLLRTRLKQLPLMIVLIANFLTMLLIGLWHGFTLQFVLWGLWHALGLFIHKAFADQTRPRQIKWRGTWKAQVFHALSVLLTFHFVSVGWVFFAFPTVEESMTFFRILVGLS